MANALNRELKKGEKLVLIGGDEVQVDAEGFGASSFTSGTALYVKSISGPNEGRINAVYDIDAKATMERFASANGWH